jgi:hypothetical protein
MACNPSTQSNPLHIKITFPHYPTQPQHQSEWRQNRDAPLVQNGERNATKSKRKKFKHARSRERRTHLAAPGDGATGEREGENVAEERDAQHGHRYSRHLPLPPPLSCGVRGDGNQRSETQCDTMRYNAMAMAMMMVMMMMEAEAGVLRFTGRLR